MRLSSRFSIPSGAVGRATKSGLSIFPVDQRGATMTATVATATLNLPDFG